MSCKLFSKNRHVREKWELVPVLVQAQKIGLVQFKFSSQKMGTSQFPVPVQVPKLCQNINKIGKKYKNEKLFIIIILGFFELHK